MNSSTGDLLQDPSLFPASSAPANNATGRSDITAVVSGSNFNIIPKLFQKVEALSWYDVQGVPHLNANPDLFEVILQYYLFGCLPKKNILEKLLIF